MLDQQGDQQRNEQGRRPSVRANEYDPPSWLATNNTCWSLPSTEMAVQYGIMDAVEGCGVSEGAFRSQASPAQVHMSQISTNGRRFLRRSSGRG